jgi:hypothetical protein
LATRDAGETRTSAARAILDDLGYRPSLSKKHMQLRHSECGEVISPGRYTRDSNGNWVREKS